jgi:phage tail-like protein
MRPPVLHALLRDRRTWPDCRINGLVADAEGALSLLRVPAPDTPVRLPGPYEVVPSGLAAGPGGIIAVADTTGRRLLVHDTVCGSVTALPGRGTGTFARPCGVAIGRAYIWVADASAGRVLGVSRSTLGAAVTIGGLVEPIAVHEDRAGRVTVLDADAGMLRRFAGPAFAVDPTLTQDWTAHLTQPLAARALAVDDAGLSYVSDGTAERVLRIDAAGAWAGPLPVPAVRRPGALAVRGDTLAMADLTTGEVVLVSTATGAEVGTVGSYSAPVAALAWTEDGALLIKVDGGTEFVTARAGQRAVAQGDVITGPLDAGVDLSWFRAFVEAEIPDGATVELAAAQFDNRTTAPADGDWRTSPAPDVRLDALDPSPDRRFLHVRVRLRPAPSGRSPVLRQVTAHTEGDGPQAHLPRAYRRADEATGFLTRLLGHAAAALDRLERSIDDLPQNLGPQFIDASALEWSAAWVALELPLSLRTDEWRALVPRALDLHERRGTPQSLRELVRLYTGADIAIDEDFAHRRVWVLDGEPGSLLGFDTGLPAVVADGFVLGDREGLDAAPPACAPEIGGVSVGAAAALPAIEWGTVLYSDTAHRFRVRIDAATACIPGMVDAIEAVLERERPAHTECCVEVVPNRFTVGLKAHVGVDAVVVQGPPPGALDDAFLGPSFRLDGPEPVDDVTVGRSIVS